jgi:hypothetical protein
VSSCDETSVAHSRCVASGACLACTISRPRSGTEGAARR